MKQITAKVSVLLFFSLILFSYSIRLAGAVQQPLTLAEMVANAIQTGNVEQMNLLLSEIDPKVTSVCTADPKSNYCIEYSTYRDNLVTALNPPQLN